MEISKEDHWANIIQQDLSHTVNGFLAAGQHLLEARKDIPHGQWERWLKEKVHFSKQWADRLMTLAKSPALNSNVKYTLRLPPHVETLYTLSQLDPVKLNSAIDSGKISPETKQTEAKALVAELSGKKPPVKKEKSLPVEKSEPVVIKDKEDTPVYDSSDTTKYENRLTLADFCGGYNYFRKYEETNLGNFVYILKGIFSSEEDVEFRPDGYFYVGGNLEIRE